jgi:hypothetical protein
MRNREDEVKIAITPLMHLALRAGWRKETSDKKEPPLSTQLRGHIICHAMIIANAICEGEWWRTHCDLSSQRG